jgi:hypothetical protein
VRFCERASGFRIPSRPAVGSGCAKGRIHDRKRPVGRNVNALAEPGPSIHGEEFFRHKPPFDRSSLTRWRQRMGEDKLVALVQESLAVATRAGVAKPADFAKVIVDTTVQPKAVARPIDGRDGRCVCANPMSGSATGADRPSALRPRQAVQAGGQGAAHDPHLTRARRARHRPQDQGDAALQSLFGIPLMLARRVREQRQNARGRKKPALGPRPEGLFDARPRGRIHRQGQGP